ncbi:MAG: hypothetical protein JNM07_09855 [Phycisphaerae bacterium]|nr:hypothetical protein [Phycisphaerae bacterium]
MTGLTRGWRLSVLGIGVALLVSAAVGFVIGLGNRDGIAWFFVSFEAVAALGGAVALLTGLGRFQESPAWALACSVVALVAAAVLGYVASGTERRLMGVPVVPLSALRVCAAGVLGLAACSWLIAPGGRGAWRRFFIGLVLLAPFPVLAYALARGGLLGWILRQSGGARIGLLVAGVAVLLPALAMGVQLVADACASRSKRQPGGLAGGGSGN